MADRANLELSEQVEAALAWWREAGVDRDYHDEPAQWLDAEVGAKNASAKGGLANRAHPLSDREIAPREDSSAEGRGPPPRGDTGGKGAEHAAPPAITIDPATLPQDLAAFRDWWLNEPSLDNGRTSGRVAPRGEAGPDLMAIVPEPEREDTEILLSGPQGRLFDAMLSAFGLSPESIYLASALPRHTPMADWTAVAAQGLGQVLRHHIGLVAPRRLLVLGSNALSLLGNDLPNSGQNLFQLNHEQARIPLLSATDLGVLLVRPRAKARVWQQWLEWTGIGTT